MIIYPHFHKDLASTTAHVTLTQPLIQALYGTLIGLRRTGCVVDNMLTHGEAERSKTTCLTFRLTVEKIISKALEYEISGLLDITQNSITTLLHGYYNICAKILINFNVYLKPYLLSTKSTVIIFLASKFSCISHLYTTFM